MPAAQALCPGLGTPRPAFILPAATDGRYQSQPPQDVRSGNLRNALQRLREVVAEHVGSMRDHGPRAGCRVRTGRCLIPQRVSYAQGQGYTAMSRGQALNGVFLAIPSDYLDDREEARELLQEALQPQAAAITS